MRHETEPVCSEQGGGHGLALRLYVKTRTLMCALADDSGQDLVEYALVLALIALAATVSMNSLATSIATAFTAVGTKFTAATS